MQPGMQLRPSPTRTMGDSCGGRLRLQRSHTRLPLQRVRQSNASPPLLGAQLRTDDKRRRHSEVQGCSPPRGPVLSGARARARVQIHLDFCDREISELRSILELAGLTHFKLRLANGPDSSWSTSVFPRITRAGL